MSPETENPHRIPAAASSAPPSGSGHKKDALAKEPVAMAEATALNLKIDAPVTVHPPGATSATPHHAAPAGVLSSTTTSHPHGDKESGLLKRLHTDVQKIEQDLAKLTTIHEGGASPVTVQCGDCISHAGAESKARAEAPSAHATPTTHGVAVHSVTTPHVHAPGATVIAGP